MVMSNYANNLPSYEGCQFDVKLFIASQFNKIKKIIDV